MLVLFDWKLIKNWSTKLWIFKRGLIVAITVCRWNKCSEIPKVCDMPNSFTLRPDILGAPLRAST